MIIDVDFRTDSSDSSVSYVTEWHTVDMRALRTRSASAASTKHAHHPEVLRNPPHHSEICKNYMSCNF